MEQFSCFRLGLDCHGEGVVLWQQWGDGEGWGQTLQVHESDASARRDCAEIPPRLTFEITSPGVTTTNDFPSFRICHHRLYHTPYL